MINFFTTWAFLLFDQAKVEDRGGFTTKRDEAGRPNKKRETKQPTDLLAQRVSQMCEELHVCVKESQERKPFLD